MRYAILQSDQVEAYNFVWPLPQLSTKVTYAQQFLLAAFKRKEAESDQGLTRLIATLGWKQE